MNKVNMKEVVTEISSHLAIIEDNNDAIKSLIEGVHKQTGINKKVLRKVAVVWHKCNKDDWDSEHQIFDQLWNEVE